MHRVESQVKPAWIPPFCEQVLYSAQTFPQSTPLPGGSVVVPGTYSGHSALPGASGMQVPGLGAVPAIAAVEADGVGVGDGGGAYAADQTRSLPSVQA